MDLLKLIPQVFFDAIGRVVPGAFCLVCVQAATGWPLFERLVAMVAPNDQLQRSSLVWILVVATSAYITGHFIAPFVRYLERQPGPSAKSQPSGATASGIRTPDDGNDAPGWRLKLQSLGESILPFRQARTAFDPEIWLQYDWLRLEKPEVGGLVARIRAEYTMYGGFAVALMLTLLLRLAVMANDWFAFPEGSWRYPLTRNGASGLLTAVLVAMATVLMLRRHRDTYRTFGRSVENFYLAAEGAQHWKREFLGQSGRQRRADLATRVTTGTGVEGAT